MSTQQTVSTLWPPRVGDYARVRSAGLLGEVIDIARKGDGRQYTLNLFAQDTDKILVYQLDDLEPVWHGRSEWDSPISWPSWTR